MSPLGSLIHWADTFGLQLLASLAVWATSVLVVAWLVARRLRHSSSAVRYCVWQLGLTGLLILPMLTLLLPGIPLGFALGRNPQTEATVQQPIAVAATGQPLAASPSSDRGFDRHPTTVSNEPADFLPDLSEQTRSPANLASASAERSAERAPITPEQLPPPATPLPWPLLLVSAWGLGVLLNLLWLACCALRVRSLLCDTQTVDDPRFEQIGFELQPQHSPSRAACLLTSSQIHVPAVVGFRRPRILLPAACTAWSTERIRIVLAHELAHVERQDIFWQLVARLSAALYWFHPLVWLAVGRMRAERERSCDDRVLLGGVQPADYASGLVDVAATLIGNETFAVGGIGMASRCQLEDRLRAILDRSSSRGPASAGARRALSTGTAAIVLALGLLRPFSPVISVAADPPQAVTESTAATGKTKNANGNLAANDDNTAKDKKDQLATPTDDDLIIIPGRVLDPAGRPVSDATIRLVRWYGDPKIEHKPLAETNSDNQGRFEISYRKSQYNVDVHNESQSKQVVVAAFKQGYGPDWIWWHKAPASKTAELRLAIDDLPITGRLVDLEGRPLAGVHVERHNLSAPLGGDLSAWIDVVKRGETPWTSRRFLHESVPLDGAGLGPAPVTDADGRFRLDGIGRERVVELQFVGSSVVRTSVRAVTRNMPSISQNRFSHSESAEKISVVGADFELALPPTRVIEGVVRDAKTGEALAGVDVQSWRFSSTDFINNRQLLTASDSQGHFRLIGMPKGSTNEIIAIPNDEQPYLMRVVKVPDEPGLEPAQVEIELHRGIWITGRVTNQSTGAPLQKARLYYLPYVSNPYTEKLPEFHDGNVDGTQHYQNRYLTAADGTYRLIGLPGRAIVGVKTFEGAFAQGQGVSDISGINAKGEFPTYYNPLKPGKQWPNAMREIDAAEGTDVAALDFAVASGGQIEITTVDPASRPLSSVKVKEGMSRHGGEPPADGSTVLVTGLAPAENRTVLLHDDSRRLGKAIRLHADDATKQISVVLEPYAKIMGRLVDANQMPVVAAEIEFWVLPQEGFSPHLTAATTDADGHFEHSEVLPGARYNIVTRGIKISVGTVAADLAVEPGETIDLGTIDVTGDQRPEPVRTKAATEAPADKQTSKPPAAPKAARPKEATTSGSMQISVVDGGSQPMPGARIHIGVWSDDDALPNRDYVCDTDGHADVALPAKLSLLRIWASRDGYVPLFAQWSPERQNDGASIPKEFTFRMQKGTTIGGIVNNSQGQPIPAARVEVRYTDDVFDKQWTDRPLVCEWLAEGNWARITDDQGRWKLDNVPAGDDIRLTLKLTHPDYVSDMSWGDMQTKQNVTSKALRAETATIAMQRGTAVTGTLTDPDGKPVAGAVVVWGDRPYLAHHPQQEVLSDENGRYRFPPLPDGPMTVTVMAKGWMPERRVIDIARDLPPVDFRLQPGKTLKVRFVDQSGNAVPEVSAQIKSWRGKESLYNDQHPNVLATGIPRKTQDGVYLWTWAPADAVTYRFTPWHNAHRFADEELALTANDQEQVVTLRSLLHIVGRVVDARTDKPIEQFTVIPVLELNPSVSFAEREQAETYTDGQYALDFDRTDAAYRVRIEADGYRTAMSDAYRVGEPDPTCDFRLEPAAPIVGRIFGPDGKPLAGAKIFLATKTQPARVGGHEFGSERNNESCLSDAHGTFAFPAQFERYTLIARHALGYAEVTLAPDQSPGNITLSDWAHIEGRVLQTGLPVGGLLITLDPLRPRLGDYSDIEDQLTTKTDEAGRFVFEQVPPGKSVLWVNWQHTPPTASELVPLDLKPGQHATRDVGAAGIQLRGRVVPPDTKADDIDLTYSRVWLVRKAFGIDPPQEIADQKFDWRDGWNDAWDDSPKGNVFLETLDHYFVKLGKDGSFLVSGVPAGEYCLAIKVYDRQKGETLVPTENGVVRFTVTAADVAKGTLDLGKIDIDAAAGSKPAQ